MKSSDVKDYNDSRYSGCSYTPDKLSKYNLSLDKYMNEIFDADFDPDFFNDDVDYNEQMMCCLKVFEDRINSDAYDDLDAVDVDHLEYDLYLRIRKYIPADFVQNFDAAFYHCRAGEAYTVVDSAVFFLLANADSEYVFSSVIRSLGIFTWRINNLTDGIYNCNPDQGCIWVSREGEFKWFPFYFIKSEDYSCFNKWLNGLQYNGKFIANVSETPLCLREYHPELITDAFSDDDLSVYKPLYEQYVNDHGEMYSYIDDDGDEIVVGNWYYNGIYKPGIMQEAAFLRKYDSYVFTEDECRKLLSNEDITVNAVSASTGQPCTCEFRLVKHFVPPNDVLPRVSMIMFNNQKVVP